MDDSSAAAAPESGNDTPTFEQLEADPEIAPLLAFTPVPRSHAKANGWTAEMQRMFIAWLAHYGSPTNACDELGKARSGIDKVRKSPDAGEFRASWDGAIELAEKRRIARLTARHSGAGALRPRVMSRATPPRTDLDINGNPPEPGQVLNEYDEYEDQSSLDMRVEEARDSISAKLFRLRRMYLGEISGCPGKRAAFEILTGFAIDWDKAARFEPQIDEPYRAPNMREPDMLLTGENGWFGEFTHGPNKMAELRKAFDEHRAAEGLEPVQWNAEGDNE